MTKSLGQIIDDPRINLPADEVERIARNKRYYMDDFKQVTHKNSYGDTQKHELQSVNVTKLASAKLASLIFNEQCQVTIGDETANDFLDAVFQDNDFYTTFEEKLEEWIALGSGCVRPYVVGGKIKLAWATADQVYPLQADTNQINELAIASRTTEVENHRTIYYTLLEFHQWDNNGDYVITNELYRSETAETVGINVPLNSLEQYEGLEPQVKITGLKYPLFAFYRNKGANNKNFTSPMGMSLIDNSYTVIDAINRTHDQFVDEVKKGQRRLIVPAEWLKTGSSYGGQASETHPPMFDPDETVYQAMYGDASEVGFHDATSPIRVADYQATMDFFLREFENQTGLSQGTFTTSPNGIQTATEVVTNNSQTYQTRSSYITQVEKTIKALTYAIFELASVDGFYADGQARWTGDVDNLDITINFNDGVFVDQDSRRTADLQAVQAQVMPKKQFLMRNYGLDEEEADKWLAQIDAENSTVEPEFDQFGGE
ncbi:phage portal protein [Lactobacillus delbrueckii subsp. bulgaricus]|uniref:phage portal protein n=1 Tax=Lactobacillus delbrueckii TaxID=1584 RepID=UPI001E45F2A4|nr:phage portal protein [Lactobacillus delbrueckii]MCD5464866.1 phage portal protein [Lactobacillus delbrueckii subsp. bulgaricus]MCD5482398.1 phage portal protein [Lactobacillus delbrueckii subsp. bulgaricus]MCD5482450.1 phage portal protein [Lactobacillus delbrueckii subsp. bulgaricus]